MQDFDFQSFFNQVRLIKREFDISLVKRSNDRNRRRIAILVVDEFLKTRGGTDQAFYLEANLYQALKKVSLRCSPTPEEIRLRQLPRRRSAKIRRFDPLKLVSENADLEYEKPYPLTETILAILTEDKENSNGISGDNIRRGTSKTFKHLQKDARLFTKQKRPSLYRAD